MREIMDRDQVTMLSASQAATGWEFLFFLPQEVDRICWRYASFKGCLLGFFHFLK